MIRRIEDLRSVGASFTTRALSGSTWPIMTNRAFRSSSFSPAFLIGQLALQISDGTGQCFKREWSVGHTVVSQRQLSFLCSFWVRTRVLPGVPPGAYTFPKLSTLLSFKFSLLFFGPGPLGSSKYIGSSEEGRIEKKNKQSGSMVL